jgi:hypothetical protein
LQAVNGSEDATSGFGYSFLMKKPKKLLILDKDNQLGFLDSENKKNDLKKLKRLGIDIERKPIQSSIYNHQFMIIVDNDEKKHYNEWFNLPQERCLYSHKVISTTDSSVYNYFFFLRNEGFQLVNFFLRNEGFQLVNTEIKRGKELDVYLGEAIIKLSNFSVLNIIKTLIYNSKQIKLCPSITGSDLLGTNNLSDLGMIDSGWLNPKLIKKRNLVVANFDHHGGRTKTEFIGLDYCEIYGSTSPVGLYLESISQDIEINKEGKLSINNTKADVQYFFTKAVNTKVIVVDERIQGALYDSGTQVEASINDKKEKIDSYSLTYKELFDACQILVPEKKMINLNEGKLYDHKLKLEIYLKENSLNTDYLIIHFGIIESLRNSADEDFKNVSTILNWIENSIPIGCNVVITSGRGFTPDIKKLDRYFLAYSTLSNFLLDPYNRSKAHFVKCLEQLRILKN